MAVTKMKHAVWQSEKAQHQFNTALKFAKGRDELK